MRNRVEGKRMEKFDWLVAIVSGASATVFGSLALENMISHASMKSAAFQAELSKAPELTQQAYDSAWYAIEKVSSANLTVGLLNAAVAGAYLGGMLYYCCKKAKE